MLSQAIANKLLKDIVDAYNYKDAPMLRRKLKNAKEKVEAVRTTPKTPRPEIIWTQCKRKMKQCTKDLCRTCYSKNSIGRPKQGRGKYARSLGKKEKACEGN